VIDEEVIYVEDDCFKLLYGDREAEEMRIRRKWTGLVASSAGGQYLVSIRGEDELERIPTPAHWRH